MKKSNEQTGDTADIDFDALVLDLTESLAATIELAADPEIETASETAAGAAVEAADEAAAEPSGEEKAEAKPAEATLPARAEAAGERLTAHTHGRLAALAAMNEARSLSQQNLEIVSEAIAGLFAANEMSRQFLDASHADIKRANRLEVENGFQVAECRRLADQIDRLRKECERHETQAEVQKAREARFVTITGKLRENLHAAKLGLAEATNLLTASQARQVELQADLLARGNIVDRLTRETDMLRGKVSNMTADLDSASRKLTETRRQHEELVSIHSEAAENHAEKEAKLAALESELSRLQKLTDFQEARLADAEGALKEAALEAEERETRYQSELRALRQENQTLNSRLCLKAAEQLEAVAENMMLKSRLDELETMRQWTDRQPLEVANDHTPALPPALDEGSRGVAAPLPPAIATRGKRRKKASAAVIQKSGGVKTSVRTNGQVHAV